MNKKAIFMPIFSIFVLLLLAYSYHLFFVKESDQYTNLGENQINILKAYNKGEEYYFNLQNIIKYASDSAIIEFSKNAGIPENCKLIWKYYSDCKPDLENNFIKTFSEELKKYGYNSKEIKIKDNFIIVNLDDFNYKKELKNFKMNYNLPIIIRSDLNLDLERLIKLSNQVKACIEKGESLTKCTNAKTDISKNIISFTIENNKKLTVYTDKLESKKIDFVFKIDINDNGIKTGVF